MKHTNQSNVWFCSFPDRILCTRRLIERKTTLAKIIIYAELALFTVAGNEQDGVTVQFGRT
jgi:hypothetical protein